MPALLLALALALTPITLHLPGHYFSGDDVTVPVQVHVPYSKENEALHVVWDSEDPSASVGEDSRQLDELTNQETFTFEIRLRPGSYVVEAVLDREHGRVVTAPQTVQVIGITP